MHLPFWRPSLCPTPAWTVPVRVVKAQGRRHVDGHVDDQQHNARLRLGTGLPADARQARPPQRPVEIQTVPGPSSLPAEHKDEIVEWAQRIVSVQTRLRKFVEAEKVRTPPLAVIPAIVVAMASRRSCTNRCMTRRCSWRSMSQHLCGNRPFQESWLLSRRVSSAQLGMQQQCL